MHLLAYSRIINCRALNSFRSTRSVFQLAGSNLEETKSSLRKNFPIAKFVRWISYYKEMYVF